MFDYVQECPPSPFGHNNETILPNGGMTLYEGQTYYALVRMRKPTLIIEAGTHVGNSTWFMSQALAKNTEEGHFGRLVTIDEGDFSEQFRVEKNNPFVTTNWGADIISWLKNNEMLVRECDFFSHDDAHGMEHIMEEIEYFKGVPTIACHDIWTESAPFWDMVLKDDSYLPEYERHSIKSLMGVGWLTLIGT